MKDSVGVYGNKIQAKNVINKVDERREEGSENPKKK